MARAAFGRPWLLLFMLAVSGGLLTQPAPAQAVGLPSCAAGPRTVGHVLYGTPCADRIVVPPNVTRVEGGPGNDVMIAPRTAVQGSCPEGCHLGIGSQIFEGGPGDDIIYGERGNDILRGGEGNDRLYGGIGDDRLEGGPGDDFLSGGFGADAIDGQAGNDFVRGDATQDEIVDSGPPSDTDTLSYATGVTPGFTKGYPGVVEHAGFPGPAGERGIYLNLATNVADNGVAPGGGGVDQVEGADFERVIGTPFADYIVGARSGLSIWGGGGADVLIAESAGERIDGGAGGDDCVGATVAVDCESEAPGGPVVPRESGETAVGLIAPPAEVGESEIYVAGASGSEVLNATYSAGPPVTVTFTISGAAFDQSASAAAGCAVSAAEATCTLPGKLDAVLIAGLGGDDQLQTLDFPPSVNLFELGGEGNDTLTGGDGTEDTLVDGPGDDVLTALGGDDALLNNAGTDHLYGGGGNDLFLSNSICEGDLMSGGEGRDNASWAKFKEGVEANVGLGQAGRPASTGAPECGGGPLDTLDGIEDLEGSNFADTLIGGPESNQLLGHQGADSYFAEGGEDTILANSADYDPTIDCGPDNDLAVIDLAQYGDVASPDCETVREATPNDFRTPTELPPEIAPRPEPAPTPAASPPSNRFRLLGIARDKRRGRAILRARVPGPGRLVLRGPRVRSASRPALSASTLALVVGPASGLAARMRSGLRRARVAVIITFIPRAGAPFSRRDSIMLVMKNAPSAH